MPALFRTTFQTVYLILIGLFLVSCGLPAVGPSAKNIRESSVENGGNVHIVDVTPSVVVAATRGQALGFSAAFISAGEVSVDRINGGDVLAITIWENVDNGLFATLGAKVTVLPEIQVDQLGNIFVPYAGTIRASGRTPNELRLKLTELLETQTPDPQIEVRRAAGDGATVSILGDVGSQGVYPIEASTRSLSGVLASSGGVSEDPSVVKITVRRGRESGQIWMQDLFDNAANDIAVKAGDQILLERDERYFVTMGATGQRRISFTTHNPTALEALASVGGLRSYTSDPRGIFVFREEPEFVARKVLGDVELMGPQQVAYIIDLTSQGGMFTAKDFEIRSEDTVYVTESPYVTWNKLVRAVIGTLGTASALNSSVTNAAEIFE